MNQRIDEAGLQIDPVLHAFVADELAPRVGVDPAALWTGLAEIVAEFAPRNAALLRRRDELQEQIDEWHRRHPGAPADPGAYRAFLEQIGYLAPAPVPFRITTSRIDPEIADQPGPQLVVPITNARFAINAANARWGSLYDAVYGSDLVPDEPPTIRSGSYNPARGAAVVAFGRELLDVAAALEDGSHVDATSYRVEDGRLVVALADGRLVGLADEGVFAGHTGDSGAPTSVLLVHHGLRLEIVIDPDSAVGAADRAGVRDILVESAVTAIMDFEDSVAVVDAADKTAAYAVWLGLMEGTVTATFEKQGRSFSRALEPDRPYTAPDGTAATLPGRVLMLVRNVGLHMYTDAVLDSSGREIPEGLLDAVMTTACALGDLRAQSDRPNSRTGSLYVVKPKQHGAAEVAFSADLFARVEDMFGLAAGSMKMGVMDEERRTSLNLDAAIAAVRDRVFFINTGFLDRTGDEIHTSRLAGPFVRKADMKAQPFLSSYEAANVAAGLQAGFPGRAQIGKGMWAMPDLMRPMYETKAAQLRAGATTAWVPSPTAATIHALHYHRVDVDAVQRELADAPRDGVDGMLQIPLAADADWTYEERRAELDGNVQSILGYVVRWVDQGIGCSKVPDLDDVALMEDRATLRISSQLLANWLEHEVVTEADVMQSLHRMAPVVDAQNAADPHYRVLVAEDGTESLSFEAARDLILLGGEQPNGYTEHILHRARRARKTADAEASAELFR
ncbi:malate synthase G [Microbacterium aurantiacum]|uniref:Malate synthase G n=1 Tax=Microbacterium aurantiacum TaxID=162393 RepID=A0AAJ2HPI3_9MICO|nr:malate synthase G [Microbacterium aurantiacum]MDS0246968.1 malate synthase G [Microbacterium aurantiacum]